MESKRFTKDHEWLAKDGSEWVMGISNFAQEQLGDVVYVSLPEKGVLFVKGAEIGVIESVKAASDIYAPVALEVVAVNEALEASPELVNEDAEGAGWLIRVVCKNPAELDELQNEASYKEENA